jgi:putative SOS response-associated peptidase YedK
MCGRYVARNQAAIERYFIVSSHQFQLSDRYDVAPSAEMPVIRLIDGECVMSAISWGLIPFWSKNMKISYKPINARAETVATKPERFELHIRHGVAWFPPAGSMNGSAMLSQSGRTTSTGETANQ